MFMSVIVDIDFIIRI